MKTLKFVFLLIVLASTSCGQQKKKSQEQQPEKEGLLNREHLIAVLDTVYRAEQEPICLRDAMIEKYGVDSEKQINIRKNTNGITLLMKKNSRNS